MDEKKITDKEFKRIESILYNYNSMITEIKCIRISIRKLEEDYRGCGAIGYSDDGGKSNSFNSVVENEVIDRERKLKEFKRRLSQKEEIIEKVDTIINEMNETEKKLIELKYKSKNKKSWKEIAKEVRFSTEHCRKNIRKKVIEQFLDKQL